MPAIHLKEKVLDGRGVVVSYKQDTTCFYYRELIPGTKSYRNRKIEGATTLDEAKRLAAITALELGGRIPESKKRKTPARKKKISEPIADAVDAFLNYEYKRVEAGIIKEITYYAKSSVLKSTMMPYLESEVVRYTRDIKENTFHNFLIYRGGKKKLTWKNEIIKIKDFISNHLVKHRLIEAEVGASKTLFPKVTIRMDDLLANPPLSKQDWMVFNKEIRHWVKEGENNSNHRVHLWRVLFWTWTLVAKNSGARPEELRKLKWKEVEVRDVGRISQSKLEQEIAELEQEGIEVIGDDAPNSGWAINPNSLGREERLIAYITVTSGKTGQYREILTNLGSVFLRWRDYINAYYEKHNIKRSVSGNDLVFGNINNEGKTYTHANYRLSWSNIRRRVSDKLQGNKFSNEPYTCYSMRSTFIQDKLLEGLDIFLLSRISGHSPDVLLRHYDRLDIRERAQEITSLPFGIKKNEDVKVELYSNKQTEPTTETPKLWRNDAKYSYKRSSSKDGTANRRGEKVHSKEQ